MRRAAVLLAACLVLAGCSSGGEPDKKETPAATVTASPTPTAAPSLSQAEAASQCTDAVAEAAPGWTDWNFDFGAWEDDPRTPPVCLGLADEELPSRGNRLFMAALLDGLKLADDPRAGS
jgi:hypothetical protein